MQTIDNQKAPSNESNKGVELYEVQINPFHIEYAVAKPNTNHTQYQLGSHIVMQFYKENLLGTIISIKTIPDSVNLRRCQIIRLATEADFNRRQ